MKKELTDFQKNAIIALFFFVIGTFVALVISLLPSNFKIILIIGSFIGICYFYDRILIKIFNLELAWWSPHIKRLELTGKDISDIDPETFLISYFIENKFKSYYMKKKKDGFRIIGNKGKGIKIRTRLNKKNLKIIFEPYLGKETISEMKKFRNYLKKAKKIIKPSKPQKFSKK